MRCFGIFFLFVSLACFGETLVLKSGKRITTQGAYEVKGRFVVFKTGNGDLTQLPVSIVDLTASASANKPKETKQAVVQGKSQGEKAFDAIIDDSSSRDYSASMDQKALSKYKPGNYDTGKGKEEENPSSDVDLNGSLQDLRNQLRQVNSALSKLKWDERLTEEASKDPIEHILGKENFRKPAESELHGEAKSEQAQQREALLEKKELLEFKIREKEQQIARKKLLEGAQAEEKPDMERQHK